MSAGPIIAGFQRARALLRKKLSGMINGIVIGDALGGPFKDIPPGQKLTFQGKELEYIDRFYHYNIGYQNNWPPETTLALYSFEAFIHIHQKDMPVKEAIHGPLLKSLFQCDKRPKLVGSGPVNSQFMRLAPLAVFACRCKLNTVQTITVALLISTRDWFKVFPAIELLLLIKSIFEGQEIIPDVLVKMAFAAKRGGYKDQFDRYLKARSMALEKITPGSDLWVWKHITESILGFSPGGRWADVQAFENGVLRVVNGSHVRDRAGAIAGALLGALGRDDLPFRFYTNIIGDIHLTGLTDRFLIEFFSWGARRGIP